MVKKYWQIFYNDIIKNKVLVILSFLVGALCFGFAVTHPVFGIDDIAGFQYYSVDGYGNMIQQGRLLQLLIANITGIKSFLPHIPELIGSILYVISSLLFCATINFITDKKQPTFYLIAFSLIYISFPTTVGKFIFNLDVMAIMVSYCACAVGVAYAYMFVKGNSIKAFILSALLIMVSISSYETFILLYICVVFSIFIIEIMLNKKQIKIKEMLIQGIKYALILFVAMAIYYSIVFILQKATNQLGVFERASIIAGKNLLEIMIIILKSCKGIFINLLFRSYLPFNFFFVIATVGFVAFLLISIRKKSFVLIFSYFMLLFNSTFIFCITGVIDTRFCQCFVFVTAIIAMLFVSMLSNLGDYKKTIIFCLTMFILSQIISVNVQFNNEYKQFQRDKVVVDTIAGDLENESKDKPVVFVGINDKANKKKYSKVEFGKDYQSVIEWCLQTEDWNYDNNEDVENRNSLFKELFSEHGYDIIKVPSQKQQIMGNEIAQQMPIYPNDGYIKDCDGFIVVRIN